ISYEFRKHQCRRGNWRQTKRTYSIFMDPTGENEVYQIIESLINTNTVGKHEIPVKHIAYKDENSQNQVS
ncbi:hypothetical protein HHI36_014178, partial [Cryptolaemus montrouzieri]